MIPDRDNRVTYNKTSTYWTPKHIRVAHLIEVDTPQEFKKATTMQTVSFLTQWKLWLIVFAASVPDTMKVMTDCVCSISSWHNASYDWLCLQHQFLTQWKLWLIVFAASIPDTMKVMTDCVCSISSWHNASYDWLCLQHQFLTQWKLWLIVFAASVPDTMKVMTDFVSIISLYIILDKHLSLWRAFCLLNLLAAWAWMHL